MFYEVIAALKPRIASGKALQIPLLGVERIVRLKNPEIKESVGAGSENKVGGVRRPAPVVAPAQAQR